MTDEDLLAFDRRHLWHPYSAIGSDEPVYPVVSADGVRLKLADGRKLIDGMSSWWSTIHGYNHPTLKQALADQVERLSHVMFGGFTHEPAVDLGRQLIDITPAPLQAIFYADSGSVAVEASLKMAVQYQQAKGQGRRTRILTVRGGYHGDTTGAMSVSDPENGMHRLFSGILPQQIYAPRPACRFHDPWDQNDFNAMRDIIERHQHETAAVIIEPIAQAAGGLWFYHPQYLRELRQACNAHGLVLIFDEIATGFGRTGELFAMHHAGVVPDILCLGKALTGGMMTMALTMTTHEIAQLINQSAAGVFMHGPTFMANPLACRAAGASIKLLLNSPWRARVSKISAILSSELASAGELPAVTHVRVLGAIGVIETRSPVNRAELCAAFVSRGVWVRPFNRYIYLMPPYIMGDEDLKRLCQVVVAELSRLTAA